MTHVSAETLSARLEPFDSVPDGYIPEDIESGYRTYGQYLGANYLPFMPADRDARILCVSCGPGFFVQRLESAGYRDVTGLDSDGQKVGYARAKGLRCVEGQVFDYLAENPDRFDVIWCGNEVNHLTKDELLEFLRRAHTCLRAGGTVMIHSQNGANPITGSDALAHNIDHQATYTEYSLRQVLEYAEFEGVEIVPVRLYVFYRNPLNYLGMAFDALSGLFFRLLFKMYAKENRIFTKKLAGIGRKPAK